VRGVARGQACGVQGLSPGGPRNGLFLPSPALRPPLSLPQPRPWPSVLGLQSSFRCFLPSLHFSARPPEFGKNSPIKRFFFFVRRAARSARSPPPGKSRFGVGPVSIPAGPVRFFRILRHETGLQLACPRPTIWAVRPPPRPRHEHWPAPWANQALKETLFLAAGRNHGPRGPHKWLPRRLPPRPRRLVTIRVVQKISIAAIQRQQVPAAHLPRGGDG